MVRGEGEREEAGREGGGQAGKEGSVGSLMKNISLRGMLLLDKDILSFNQMTQTL